MYQPSRWGYAPVEPHSSVCPEIDAAQLVGKALKIHKAWLMGMVNLGKLSREEASAKFEADWRTYLDLLCLIRDRAAFN